MVEILNWAIGEVYHNHITAACTCKCLCSCLCSPGNHSTEITSTTTTKCGQLKDGLSGDAIQASQAFPEGIY